MSEPTKILLDENEIPSHWYNVQADLERPVDPALHPGTLQPAGPDDFAPLFPMALVGQEVSQDREVEIPDEVLDIYRMWRATPLYRATRLKKALRTPARIYYKYEGGSPAGSHKSNTAVAQAYYCGYGHFDMLAYENYFSGGMVDYAYPEEEVARAMESVPVIKGQT